MASFYMNLRKHNGYRLLILVGVRYVMQRDQTQITNILRICEREVANFLYLLTVTALVDTVVR